MTRVVAIVPAKGSSDRIANKNMRVLDGEHLFKRKLRQLLECPILTQVCLDTEDDQIAEIAADLPVLRLHRPRELASNQTDGHALFAWECAQVEADIYVQAICTAPFVTADTVSRAIQALLDAPDKDSCVAVTETKQYLWNGGAPAYGYGRVPNSVELPPTVVEAMSLYAVRAIKKKKPTRRFGKNAILLPLTPEESIDVNWPEDLTLAETIAAGHRAAENLALRALMPYLGSPMLSDITREMGLACALPRELRPTAGTQLFGRAKTLELGALVDGEEWRGIYSALRSYAFVRPGDVIVVKNNVEGRAYFGNLNAQLAMRAGAVGAVIDGVTRDTDAVENLRFPVFARGTHAVDIKFEGTLRSMNRPIEVGGVTVENGDYIFGDHDGVIAIGARHWPQVRKRALEGIDREWRIGRLAAIGADPEAILHQLGDF